MDQYARLEPFDPAEDDGDEYAERLQMAFPINSVDDDNDNGKQAVLLTICRKKAFTLLKWLRTPAKPSEKAICRFMCPAEKPLRPSALTYHGTLQISQSPT